MDDHTAYYLLMVKEFFHRFGSVTYRKVPICKHLYYQFLGFINNRWGLKWSNENLSYIQEGIENVRDVDVYGWTDEPYVFDPHPGGTILMRGGIGDIASDFMPKERCFLLSPSQSEVETIKLNRPDLVAHNIEIFYQPIPPAAIHQLNFKIIQTVTEHKNDPVFGSEVFLKWLLEKVPDIIQRFDVVQRLIEEHNVGAVLTASSIHWFGSTLNLLARINRIPSITLQHGIIADSQLLCHTPILATKKSVWGEENSDWFTHYGFPLSRVSVHGSPRFDIIFNKQWAGKEKLCRILNISPDRHIAVYATQPLGGGKIRLMVPTVLNGLTDIENLFVIILLHHSEKSPAVYENLAAGFSNCRVIPFGHISLYDALSGADLFITCFSTAAIEAMLFRVPVITVEPFSTNFSYGEAGASQRAGTSEELQNIATRLFHEQSFRESTIQQYQPFIKHVCIPDGSSSQRLMTEVENLCNQGGVM